MTKSIGFTTGLSSWNWLTNPNRRTIVYATCGIIFLLFGVYFPILRNMVQHWSASEDYQHGFIVAPLALFFAYERRWDLEDAPIKGSWLGLIPMFIGLISLTIGRLGTELMTMRSGFVFTLIGLVLLLLGREIFKILAFPLFFLFLMVPLPQSLVNTIAFPLQLIAASAQEQQTRQREACVAVADTPGIEPREGASCTRVVASRSGKLGNLNASELFFSE